MEQSAQKVGKSPQDFVDEVSQNFRKLAETMQFTNDQFIRTTDGFHKAAVQVSTDGGGEGDEGQGPIVSL